MTLYLQPFARWQLSWCSPQYAAAPWPWLLTFDLEVGVGVACDLRYPCAKFRLPRSFGFRVRADRSIRDIRQTDRRTDGRTTDADDRLMPPPPLRGRGHNNELSNIDTRRNLNTFKRIFGLSHNSWKQWRLTLTAHLSANNVQAVYQCLHAAAPFFLTEMCYGYCQPALAVVVFVQQHVEIWIIWWCPERERER